MRVHYPLSPLLCDELKRLCGLTSIGVAIDELERRYKPAAASPTGESCQREKNSTFGIKNGVENHLSPSRRRAPRPFFVQTQMRRKQYSSPSQPWGCAGELQLHNVQACAGKCQRLAQRATGRCRRGQTSEARPAWAKNWKTEEWGGFPNRHRSQSCAPGHRRPDQFQPLQLKQTGRCSRIQGPLDIAHDCMRW